MEKLVQSAIANLVKWTPSGFGLGLTVHSLAEVERDWTQVVLAAFATGFTSVWVKFSGEFMKEVEREAEERGGGLARWFFLVGDRTGIATQKKISSLWRQFRSDFKDKYYQRLIYISRNYETQGLDKDKVLRLRKVFVPLKIYSKNLVKISPDLIQEIPQSASMHLEVGELLVQMYNDSTLRRLAILGAPGSGKTTLMRYLTLVYANREERKLLHSKAPVYIPVLIYLRDVREDIVKNPELSLADLINIWIERLQRSEPLKPPSGWFADKLKRNQCLVLLDGLDEIADEHERQAVSRWVDIQMEEYPEVAFILTSRPLGYQNAQLQQPVTVLEVQPFTFKQVQTFIENWYLETEIRSQVNADDLGVREEAKQQADDLIKRIRDSVPLTAMAVNPLLLTMIATVHRRGSALPGKRVELYREICQVLLERRQRAKRIPDKLTAAQKQSVLQALALALMKQETRSFTLSDVRSLVQSRLVLVIKDDLEADQFLTQAREVSGLLVAKEEGIYEFAHLSFQEYLAAVELQESNQEETLTRALNNPEQLSWWAETARLYAAQGNASGIIQAAIQADTVETLALAFDCLEEAKCVDPSVRQKLEAILNEGLESR
jgi:predicted NACHT family NTPase